MFLDFIWSLLGRIVFFTGAIGSKNSFPKPLTKEEEEIYLQMVAESKPQKVVAQPTMQKTPDNQNTIG